VTTGGLGPTFDDKTLEGIAKALGLRLKTNAKALDMIKRKYEAYRKQGRVEKVELTPARVKMATLPYGAKPLHNAVGTAPGVMLKTGKTSLFVLPGVPPEMEAIFKESVALLLAKAAGKAMFFETSLYASGIVESALAPLIDQTMHGNKHVYIKSHVYTESGLRPGEDRKRHIELHLSTTSRDREIANRRLEKTATELSRLVQKSGGKIAAMSSKL
jgi:molybdopterin-biosynthesis enzyme MoeA-like protein